ncbi:MAG: ubiquinol-cytochrome C chaperone family protein [Kiloniellales bacterium]|nr:ubiquinol-cytochrome C chaperone family protein [Kiloniellales bacterium]MDJ0969101.1 ubiquinol-cytochrome C chaperone family protein [Kiloniellales bacterium]
MGSFFGRPPGAEAATALYEAVVAQARQPAFYLRCGLPDSLDGRFEMIALHSFIVLRRLRGLGEAADEVAQVFVDTLVLDLDRSLREMGVGDLGVGKRVKRMAAGFHGRITAYDQGLASGPEELEAALRRNVFGTTSPEPWQVSAMAAYLRREVEAQPDAGLLAGKLSFGPPPEQG